MTLKSKWISSRATCVHVHSRIYEIVDATEKGGAKFWNTLVRTWPSAVKPKPKFFSTCWMALRWLFPSAVCATVARRFRLCGYDGAYEYAHGYGYHGSSEKACLDFCDAF
ncbi:GL16503 [Drosophila persimilis]|uniref:GL16503 n=1 Tax=Drosophila persimilis TaxID=7234 RepID=B4GW70_DROPE|nr:GL16503 [Drosophila persimilis]